MSTILVICRRCGREYAPQQVAFVQGPAIYSTCPDWRTDAFEQHRSRECGRPLVGTRDVCLRCMGVAL